MVGTALGVGASLIGTSIKAKASKKAGKAQQQAADTATAEQRRQFDITQANQKPFLETGTSANKRLSYLLGLTPSSSAPSSTESSIPKDPDFGLLSKSFSTSDYQADPGYAFRLSEGQKALERVQASRGGFNSGAAARGLIDYNQNAASQEYGSAYDRYNNNQNNLYNRLQGLSGAGQTAANNLGQFGANVADNVSSIALRNGTNQANQIGTRADAFGTGLNNIANIFTSPKGGFSFGNGNGRTDADERFISHF